WISNSAALCGAGNVCPAAIAATNTAPITRLNIPPPDSRLPSPALLSRRGTHRPRQANLAGPRVKPGQIRLQLLQCIDVQINHMSRMVIPKLDVPPQLRIQLHVRQVKLGNKERRRKIEKPVRRKHLQLRILS